MYRLTSGEVIERTKTRLTQCSDTNVSHRPFNTKGVVTDDQKSALSNYWQKVNGAKTIKELRPAQTLGKKEAKAVIKGRAETYLNHYRSGKKKEFISENGLNILISYFTKSADFEAINPNYSLDKGLFLRGGIYGSGKTMSLKLFSENPYFWRDGVTFESGYAIGNINSCINIENEYLQYGFEGINKYKRRNIITLDDLMQESREVQRYGEGRKNIIRDVLRARYELQQNYGVKTHATSNELGIETFIDTYGGDVVSRFSEMFNDIVSEGESKRN